MSARVVVDTAPLLWYTLDPQHLSERAATALTAAPAGSLVISALSLWEIGWKMRVGRLVLPMPFREFRALIHASAQFDVVPVSEAVLLRNVELEWTHPDPTDRSIVATADLDGLPLVTSDRAIRSFYTAAVW